MCVLFDNKKGKLAQACWMGRSVCVTTRVGANKSTSYGIPPEKKMDVWGTVVCLKNQNQKSNFKFSKRKTKEK